MTERTNPPFCRSSTTMRSEEHETYDCCLDEGHEGPHRGGGLTWTDGEHYDRGQPTPSGKDYEHVHGCLTPGPWCERSGCIVRSEPPTCRVCGYAIEKTPQSCAAHGHSCEPAISLPSGKDEVARDKELADELEQILRSLYLHDIGPDEAQFKVMLFVAKLVGDRELRMGHPRDERERAARLCNEYAEGCRSTGEFREAVTADILADWIREGRPSERSAIGQTEPVADRVADRPEAKIAGAVGEQTTPSLPPESTPSRPPRPKKDR